MKPMFLTGALLVSLGGVVFTTPQAPSVHVSPPGGGQQVNNVGQLATIKQYCAGCHNDRAKTGGVSFEGLTAGEHRPSIADVFEKAVRKLRGRVMPPPGAKQPGRARRSIRWSRGSKTRSTSAERQAHVPDQVVLHRLESQGIRERGSRSAGGRVRRDRTAAGRRRRARASTTSRRRCRCRRPSSSNTSSPRAPSR